MPSNTPPPAGEADDPSGVGSAILTLPNLISVARLALIPVLWWWMAGDRVAAAGWLLGVIGSTDWIDGYLARRLKQVSEVGKLLDPLADRLAVAAAVIGGLAFGILPAWFAWAILAREAVIGLGALILGLKARTKLAVRQLGKLATALLYFAIAFYFVGKGTPLDPLVWLAWLCAIPGLVFYYIVGVQYFRDALQAIRTGDH